MKFSDIANFNKSINEDRVPGLEYKKVWKSKKAEAAGEEAERIIVYLEGKNSAIFTVMAKSYAKIQKLIEMLVKKGSALNLKATDETEKLFDAKDKIYTRVVETISATWTLAKETETKPENPEDLVKTDWQKVATEISKLLESDLIPAYEALVQAYTTISEPRKIDPNAPKRKPALRVDVKESEQVLLEDEKIKALINKLSGLVNAWAPKFDQKLAKIKAQLA